MQKEPGQCSPPPEPEHKRERGKNGRPERTGHAGALGQSQLFPPSVHFQRAGLKSPGLCYKSVVLLYNRLT